MYRRFGLLVLALVSAAVSGVVACAAPVREPGQGFAGEPVVVNFSDRSVDPKAAHVAKDRNVRWVNQAHELAGRVVFPASIASSFRCGADLAPMFRRVPGGYASLPIEGTTGERVTLPCPLAPGTYDYEIFLFGVGFGTEGSSPQTKLPAQLIIE